MSDAAKNPTQLADDIARADTVKLRFDEEVYQLNRDEVGWIVLALRGIASPPISSRDRA